MPWTPGEAMAHNHKANTPYLRRLWSRVANSVREETGDEGKAIAAANAAVDRALSRPRRML